MKYRLSQIAAITGGRLYGEDLECRSVATDSRSLGCELGAEPLFVAMRGTNHDSHAYIEDVARRGVKAFLVEQEVALQAGQGAVVVRNSIEALQQLERWFIGCIAAEKTFARISVLNRGGYGICRCSRRSTRHGAAHRKRTSIRRTLSYLDSQPDSPPTDELDGRPVTSSPPVDKMFSFITLHRCSYRKYILVSDVPYSTTFTFNGALSNQS